MALLVFGVACDKDDKELSRTISYELAGNYTGSLIASYTTATGGTNNDPVTALPWNKEITYDSNVTAAIFAISGNGGTTGQQVTVVVKRGSTLVSTTVATADASGSFSKPVPTIIF